MAAFFGVTHATVQTVWRREGMPGNRGAYDLREVYMWRQHRPRDMAGLSSDSVAELKKSKLESEAKSARLDVLKKRLWLRVQRADVCSRDQVRRELAQILAVLRKRLASLPRRVIPMLPADEADNVAEYLARQVDAVLIAAAEDMERTFGDQPKLVQKKRGRPRKKAAHANGRKKK